MDIQRALTFMTEDENWIKKLGIGVVLTLLSFLILPAIIVTGYGIQVARNVKDGMDVHCQSGTPGAITCAMALSS